jgi:hypothetical protein
MGTQAHIWNWILVGGLLTVDFVSVVENLEYRVRAP